MANNNVIVHHDYIFPVTRSPHDSRDHKFEQAISLKRARTNTRARDLPETLDLSPFLLPSRDQGSRGTCVAQATCAVKEYQEKINVNFESYMSPDSIYFYRSDKPEEGMNCREAMDLLLHQGISPDFFFPYDPKTEPTAVPQQALDAMPNYVITEYASVQTIDGLKDALNTCGPCIIAFAVYDSFPEIWKPATPDQPSRGGHCMAVVGYNKDGFIIRNSWGAKWNGNGTVVYKYADWGIHWEIWSCVDDLSSKVISPPTWWQKLFSCCKKQ